MTEPTPPRRRWFQFGLRTMFVVVMVFSIFAGYEVNWIRQRHAFVERQEVKLNRPCEFLGIGSRPAPGLLRFFGEPGFGSVEVCVDGREVTQLTDRDRQYVREARSLFPESHIMVTHQELDGAGNGTVWSSSAP